ncbi:MAG TPA: 2-amino-4-hydroxy-6-hydroxymethyldihydropteridine diphosphokinase [Gemmatimonadaceae bacterium]|nr:2-amino-4-hydroxy-6-hydroxymethyldihydropteridine diphosphokinase [Gemmatimonadaceae bacterium]
MSDAGVRVAIALGSNMDDRHAMLHGAAHAIARLDELTVIAESRIEETHAIGPVPQDAFLNQMLLCRTALPMPALLAAVQEIEANHGRVRGASKGPRTLDIDIVWAEQVTVTTDSLLIPHPGLLDRDFWQRELVELLGADAARDAIAGAQVHAGLDTAPHAVHTA